MTGATAPPRDELRDLARQARELLAGEPFEESVGIGDGRGAGEKLRTASVAGGDPAHVDADRGAQKPEVLAQLIRLKQLVL